ncbi:hypothetical protein QTP86_018669, partial [Hemibagrus guttatus]
CTLNQQTVDVTGNEGQSVLLPCSCSELQAKPHTFRWRFLRGSHPEIFPADQTHRYTDRVQLINDRPPGNLSLLISHLTVEDGGWYRCEINNYISKDIGLTVKGKRPSIYKPYVKCTNKTFIILTTYDNNFTSSQSRYHTHTTDTHWKEKS